MTSTDASSAARGSRPSQTAATSSDAVGLSHDHLLPQRSLDSRSSEMNRNAGGDDFSRGNRSGSSSRSSSNSAVETKTSSSSSGSTSSASASAPAAAATAHSSKCDPLEYAQQQQSVSSSTHSRRHEAPSQRSSHASRNPPDALRGRPTPSQHTTAHTATSTSTTSAGQHPDAQRSPRRSSHASSQQQQQQHTSAHPASSSSTSAAAAAAVARHGEADIARVRAALADAGYPNPSWHDIERVFAQMAQTHNALADPHHQSQQATGTASQAVAGPSPHAHPRVDDLGYSVLPPQQPSQPALRRAPSAVLANDRSGLLHYLEPSRRLERYIQLRERELESMCLRPVTSTVMPTPPRAPSARLSVDAGSGVVPPESTRAPSGVFPHETLVDALQGPEYPSSQLAADATANTDNEAPLLPDSKRLTSKAYDNSAHRTRRAAVQQQQQHRRQHSEVAAMAAQHRRAANIVFNITGDQRFRFFPTTRTPQGAGAITASSSAAATTAGRSFSSAQPSGQSRLNKSAAAHSLNSSLPDGETTRDMASASDAPRDHTRPGHRAVSAHARHLTPCQNFYNPERGARTGKPCHTYNSSINVGSVSSGGGGGGGHGVSLHSQAGHSHSSVLSSHTVSYLDPQGCTLRRKADPVKRGQQMRVLWEKDNFLSQRRRPQEAWRTRQITMAYDQEALNT